MAGCNIALAGAGAGLALAGAYGNPASRLAEGWHGLARSVPDLLPLGRARLGVGHVGLAFGVGLRVSHGGGILAQMSPRLQRILSIVVFIMVGAFAIQFYKERWSKKQAVPVPSLPTKKADITSFVPISAVDLLDGQMERANMVPVSGDLRPVWTVQGRVHNGSAAVIANLTVRVTMFDSLDNAVDSANIELKGEIGPGTVQAFSRQVQLLPPKNGKFNWSWEVVDVKPRQ